METAGEVEVNRRLSSLALVALLPLAGCGSGGGSGAQPVTFVSSPQYVNRIIPGHRPMALVSASGGSGEVALTGTVTLAAAKVTLQPDRISPGGVSEVWVDIPDVADEQPFSVTVTGGSGDAQRSLTLHATAVPGVDDLETTALDIVDVFLRGYGGKVAGLPADRSGLSGGTPVAGLLVVTHYAWFTTEVEVGLSWHIMLAPDDWAELYVRPRGSLTPTRAFRLSSWSTALAGGDYTLTEIAPPSEVTR